MLVLAACQTTKIPNVRFYAEIPFKDCPEGVYVETLTRNKGLIKCDEWAKMRPYMVMVDPEGKKAIFGQWSEACRWADKGDCNVQLDSVKTVVEALDRIAGSILKP